MTDVRAVSITDGLQDALDKTIAILPKLLLFVLILIIGWILSRVISNLVDRLLERIGYNKAAQKSGLQRWLGDQKASTLTARLVFYALVLFTLQLAFGVFGPNPVSELIEGVVRWLPKAFIAVVIIVVAASIARAVRDIIEGALGQLSYGRLLATIAQVSIIALGIIAAMNQMEIGRSVTQPVLITVLATIGGILVVGVGGGLITPMRNRWERILLRAERDTSNMRAESRTGHGPAGGTGAMSASSMGTTTEPVAGTTTEPGTGKTPEPGKGTTPEPGKATTPEPGTATTPEPGKATTPEPGTGTTPEPGKGTTRKPGNRKR